MTTKPKKNSPDDLAAGRDYMSSITLSTSPPEPKAANKNEQATKTDAPQPLGFMDLPQPWEHPLKLGQVLNDIARALKDYLYLPAHAAETMTLFAAMTWIHHQIEDTAPYLYFTAPLKASGKTTATIALCALCRRPLTPGMASNSAYSRIIDEYQPTVGLDNVDGLLSERNEIARELQQTILYSFQRQTASRLVSRSVSKKGGDDWMPVKINTWSPKIMNGIGAIRDDIMSRCIVIPLRRRPEGVKSSIKPREWAALAPMLQSQLMTVMNKNSSLILESIHHELPHLNNRRGDLWRVFMAIARAAGEQWLDLCHQAMEGLAPELHEDRSDGEVLLHDIREIFEGLETGEYLTYSTLIEDLCERNDRWSEYNSYRAIRHNQLGKLLGQFQITPQRKGGRGKQERGITRADILRACEEYQIDW